ncbi:hypothetical protein JW898_02730 [Candidatus Woesearchaeota archaeon]|nr:hypothetical protein [Candidatus Woesearchaeota archaeon]
MKNCRNRNRGMFASRKAVSPLIATVLLIAFAVALGAVVMNWGRGYVEDTANIARERSDTEVTCASEVDIGIVEIDSVPQICYNSTGSGNATLEFILENKQERAVEKIQVRLIGDATRVPLTIDKDTASSNLSANEAKFMNVTFNIGNSGGTGLDIGHLQQARMTPYIRVGGSTVACPASSETITAIKPCTDVWT